MVGARGPPMYHVPGNIISATVGLVYINLQPEYELTSSTHFGQLRKFGKIGVGSTILPSHPKGNSFCTGSEFLFLATCVSDLTCLALFRDISCFPKLGPITIIRVQRVYSGTIVFHGYDFLLVINCTRGRI